MLVRKIEEAVNKEIPRLSSQLEQKANEKDLVVERNRIDNIINVSSGEADNIEVSDARIGADGSLYKTLGESKRSEISNVFDIPLNYWNKGNQTATYSSGTYRRILEELTNLTVGESYIFKVGSYINSNGDNLASIGFRNSLDEVIKTVYNKYSDSEINFTVPEGTVKVTVSLWINGSTPLTQETTAYFNDIKIVKASDGPDWILKDNSFPTKHHVLNDIRNRTRTFVLGTGGSTPVITKTGETSKSVFTVSFNDDDNNLQYRLNDGTILIQKQPLGASYIVENNKALIWNVDTNEFYVSTLAQDTINVVVLLFNSYGVPYGEFTKYYDRQRISELEINKGDFVFDNYIVPEYYEEHIKNKILEIQNLEHLAGKNGDSFIFFTDIHWESNTKNSPSLIKRILENTNVNKVICGGDIVNGGNKNLLMSYQRDFSNKVNFLQDNMYLLRGNHETNPYTTGQQISEDETYSILFKKQEKLTNTNEFYFSFDNKAQKIKYIALDTGENGDITVLQLQFLKNILESIQENWSVVILSHIMTNKKGVLTYDGGELVKVLDAYKNRITVSTQGVSFDFTNANGELVGVFYGHVHVDLANKSETGVNYVSTTCDTFSQDNSQLVRTQGTINEQAFDVVVINKTNKTFDMVRIGAGENRTISY